MRTGFVYAAICVSIAAFSQVDAKTVTEYRTVTTTEYRDSTAPTNTAIVDEKPKNEIPPEVNNGNESVVSKIETLPPMATATGSKIIDKPAHTAKPTHEANHTAAPASSVAAEAPRFSAPAGTASAAMPSSPAGTAKPGNLNNHKVSSAAGRSYAKSSATASATGYDFSPMTLAPESSLTLKPTPLREMTASKHAGAATTDTESTSAGRSAFYGISYAAVAGMTVLGMVAGTLVL